MPEPDDRPTIPKELWSRRHEPADGHAAPTEGDEHRDPSAADRRGAALPAHDPLSADTASRSRLSRRYLVLKLVQTVWLAAVTLEGLIGIRVLLHLFNASREAVFHRLVHAVTTPVLLPFAGLVPSRTLFGGELEVSALVAMVVYLLVTLVIVRSLRILLLWPPR